MIGILGGTFDPIHNGHLQIARQAMQQLPLDEVQFMPCAIPVHRAKPLTSSPHRLRMIELAIATIPGFTVNTSELDRATPSYTIDSLREFQAESGQVRLLLLGADAYNGFHSWKQPDEILKLAHLVVCMRPGVDIDKTRFASHWVDTASALSTRPAGAIFKIEIEECDCSSSAIRQALKNGASRHDCLAPAVNDYINQNRLYRSSSD